MAEPVILFGCGRNAEKAVKTVKGLGYGAVCFADSYAAAGTEKYGLPVIKPSAAFNDYPTAEYYVTPNPPVKFEIMDFLIKNGVEKQRIINYEPFSYRKSCRMLEEGLHFSGNAVSFCCLVVIGHIYDTIVPKISVDSLSNAEVLEAWNNLYKKCIGNIKNDKKGAECVGCPNLYTSYWPDERKTAVVGFGASQHCNINCCYCARETLPISEHERALKRNIELAGFLFDKGVLTKEIRVGLTNGEISIEPTQSEICSLFQECYCTFLTNALVYSREIERVLKSGRSVVAVSLDSGTAETYEKIKGVNAFDKVKDNIRRYARHGEVKLKYILLPDINCNEDDIKGFIEFANEINGEIILSRHYYKADLFMENENVIVDGVNMFFRFNDKGKSAVKFDADFFDVGNAADLREKMGLTEPA
jgi:pyruvate-formate lyase-activating enzyme